MRPLHLAVLVLALALSGCADAVRATVRADPNPFRGQPYFALGALDERALVVSGKPAGAYTAALDPDRRRIFLIDAKSIDETFSAALVARAQKLGVSVVIAAQQATSAPFVVQPVLERLDPGGFGIGWQETPSRAVMKVRVTTRDGRLLDELALDHTTSSDNENPSQGQRWRADAKALGEALAEYLKARVDGG